MTEKKHHHHKEIQPEEVSEIKAEAVEMPESGEPAQAEFEALQQKLAEAEAQASEFKDGWIRAQAEFQNYRKRIERDDESKYASMKGDIIKKILPALDDLERALQKRPEDNPWANGIELITRKLQTILESEGVKRIQAEGAAFDPNFHEAISHEPSDTVESGYVIAVVQNGYMFGERVIRPALVRVAQ
ncbi:MAG: nucleotide exchange factor GrpE [Chloroflexi bacterium]|nr:nucleotide exchange factor GrpE [Chloroflexota bacterium]